MIYILFVATGWYLQNYNSCYRGCWTWISKRSTNIGLILHSERYPSYREKLSTVVSKEKASQLLQKTREVFEWLQSLKM